MTSLAAAEAVVGLRLRSLRRNVGQIMARKLLLIKDKANSSLVPVVHGK
jgi:hypothetical protein